MRLALALALVLPLAATAAPAVAQEAPLAEGAAVAPEADPAPGLSGDALADLRLAFVEERREAGITLLSVSLLSVLSGTVVAIAGHQDPLLLAFGFGTASWGAIDALLSLGLLDLGGGGAAQAEALRELSGEDLARARQQAILDPSAASTIFALNLGLDVFYVGTGILLFFLADQLTSQDEGQLLRGYAISQISQGGLLFAFDLVEWLRSADRASRASRLPFVRF